MSTKNKVWQQVFSRLVSSENRLREAASFTCLNLKGIKHLYNYKRNLHDIPHKKMFFI